MKTIKCGPGVFPRECTCFKCKSVLLVNKYDLYRVKIPIWYDETEPPEDIICFKCQECGYENKVECVNSGDILTAEEKDRRARTCIFHNCKNKKEPNSNCCSLHKLKCEIGPHF
jgi:hypothetical protein